MRTQNKRTGLALNVIIVTAVLSWFFYFLALWVEQVVTFDAHNAQNYDTFSAFTYFIFLSIVSLAIGSLVAKRLILKSQTEAPLTPFTEAVYSFANTVIIVSLSLAVFAALTGFLSQFFGYFDEPSTLNRIFNAYVPIVLYTVLVVSHILFGFVFTSSLKTVAQPATSNFAATQNELPQHEKAALTGPAQQTTGQVLDTSATNAEPGAPAENTDGVLAEKKRIGLAYTLPIVAVAFALILGLIVYDLTKTALEVWVWVIIQTIVVIGIIAGAFFAAKTTKSNTPLKASATGAGVLSQVLAIVFAVVVTVMSLTYTAQAVDQLRFQKNVTLDLYAEDGAPENAYVYGYADGIERKTVFTLELRSDSGAEVLETSTADRYGFMSFDAALPEELTPGENVLVLTGVEPSGDTFELEAKFRVKNDGTIRGSSHNTTYLEPEDARLKPITAGWIMSDLLPAFVLFFLVLTVLNLTIRLRKQ